MVDDDDDFPLADHPGPGGPKAGDREVNRARDLGHMDVRREAYEREAYLNPPITSPENAHLADDDGSDDPLYAAQQAQLSPAPSGNVVVAAWQAFKQTSGYTGAINSVDPGWAMFMAGYAARDSRP